MNPRPTFIAAETNRIPTMRFFAPAVACLGLLLTAVAARAGDEMNLLRDPPFETLGKPGAIWKLSVNKQTAATAERVDEDGKNAVVITIPAAAAQVWHIQFQQNNVALVKDVKYTLRFTAKSDQEFPITILIQQEEKPYAMVGVSETRTSGPTSKEFVHEFTARADEPNTKISLALGAAAGKVTIGGMSLVKVSP